jgi:hypothetical protein
MLSYVLIVSPSDVIVINGLVKSTEGVEMLLSGLRKDMLAVLDMIGSDEILLLPFGIFPQPEIVNKSNSKPIKPDRHILLITVSPFRFYVISP